MPAHSARIDWPAFRKLAPDVNDVAVTLSQAVRKGGLDSQLIELVMVRASQINGCVFCLQHHILAAEGLGVSADKLGQLAVWREAPIYTPRERVALEWTEVLTLVSQGVSDEVYAENSSEFSDKELAYLTSAIVNINLWNRLGAAFRWPLAARSNSK
jgi:AhpD family alkylhydroperoxidase